MTYGINKRFPVNDNVRALTVATRQFSSDVFNGREDQVFATCNEILLWLEAAGTSMVGGQNVGRGTGETR